MADPYMARNALAAIRQATGKRYPDLEKLLDRMSTQELQDVIRLVRDTEDGGRRKAGSNARRMGLGHLVR
jgi:hypothetical protein